MRRLTKSRTEGDAVRACSPPQRSPQGRVPDFVKRMLDDVLFDTQLRWVEKSGQAPHWTTFVLDAGDPTVNVGSADKTPPKVECRPTSRALCRLGIVIRPPQPLLIEKLMLKLRTKAQSCLSSPNHSLDLQLADVTMSSPTCIKPNVDCCKAN